MAAALAGRSITAAPPGKLLGCYNREPNSLGKAGILEKLSIKFEVYKAFQKKEIFYAKGTAHRMTQNIKEPKESI